MAFPYVHSKDLFSYFEQCHFYACKVFRKKRKKCTIIHFARKKGFDTKTLCIHISRLPNIWSDMQYPVSNKLE